MKKTILFFIIFFMFCFSAQAKTNFDKIIKTSGISQNSVAISVKNIDSEKVVYKLNDKILMHPASVQKILMLVPIVETLGSDFNLSTELYKRGNNSYLLKLGADPYLTTSDLESLVSKIDSSKITKMYIDDSIIESKDWGEGWQWDDDLNVYTPRFNSYNLDGNIFKFTFLPTEQSKQAKIINQSRVPLVLFNNVVTGEKNNVSVSRDNVLASNMLKFDGTVNSTFENAVPNNNLKRYFYLKLNNVLENNRIYLKESYSTAKKSSDDIRILSITHPISKAVDDILLNSNNMSIESLAKIAGGKYFNKQGTDVDGIKLFEMYCERNNLNNSRIKLVDASGVSKNNLVDADFISEFLVKSKNEPVLNNMATPGQGTLTDRMLPLKDNLKAKTGTLSDISSIAGFLTTKNGNKYAFSIMINDPASSSSQKKNLEDYIIRDMYLNL